MNHAALRPISYLFFMALLCIAGVRLRNYNIALARELSGQQAEADGIDRLVPQTAAGKNIAGTLIDFYNAGRPHARVLFVLRTGSVLSDFKYWERVRNKIPPEAHVGLIGYCQDATCATLLTHEHVPAGLEILPYGEYLSAKAVLAEDQRNGCYILRDKHRKTLKFAWRGPSQYEDQLVHFIADNS